MSRSAPAPAAPPDLIGVQEAARILGCSSATVKRRAQSGTLEPAHKMPGASGAYLFDRSVVEAHLRQHPAGIGDAAALTRSG